MRALALVLLCLASCTAKVDAGVVSPTDGAPGDAGAADDDPAPADEEPADQDPAPTDGEPTDQDPGPTDDDPPARVPASLTLELHRDPSASGFVLDVTLRVADDQGAAWSGAAPTLSTAQGVAGAVLDAGDGSYTARVTASIASGVMSLRASVSREGAPLVVERDVLVLPQIAARWDVPELVPGLVNTPGTEDSSEISPDGEWLIVGTYSPVDIICCLISLPGLCEDAGVAGTHCNHALGPVSGEARPNMLGGERVLSATDILHAAPSLGLAEAGGGDLPFALPPVAAYGFKRAADGSFAEPFVIGVDMDGFTTAPFGFSFIGAPVDGEAAVLFSWAMPTKEPQTGNDLYIASVQLGQDVILGRYSVVEGAPVLSDFTPGLLELPNVDDNQGNPAFGLDRLWWDSEHADTLGDDLWMIHADQLDTATETHLPQSSAEQRELQPFVDGARLYYSVDTLAIHSAELVGSDFASAASWTAPVMELGAEGLPASLGNIVGMGEPSLAHAVDGTWLYFVVYLRTDTGLNGEIARVRARD